MKEYKEWTGVCVEGETGRRLQEFIEGMLKELKLSKSKRKEMSKKILEGVMSILGEGSIFRA